MSKNSKEESLKMMKEEEEDSVKWIKHYSSSHQILLVGEGDFSFSLSLVGAFHSAHNIVATSLDSRDVVIKKYRRARSNLGKLEKLGATILHGVDATKMKIHTDLKMRKFDRVIFNFPHAGFHGKEAEMHQIRLHRNLVVGFFKCASQMLRPHGEVHITHKTTKPFCCWKLEELASKCHLGLLECVKFERTDYPGYQNKRGDGPRCDEPFRLGECSTFKFVIMHSHQYKKQAKMGCLHEGDLRIEPPANHNNMQGIIEIEFGNPRISIRINAISGSHTVSMEGILSDKLQIQVLNDRTNVLPSYHPPTEYKAPAKEHENSEVFSSTAGISPPNAYKVIDQVVTPGASNNRNDQPVQHGDLEIFRSSNHSLLPELRDDDIRIFGRNDHHHAAAYMPKSHEDEVFWSIDHAQ